MTPDKLHREIAGRLWKIKALNYTISIVLHLSLVNETHRNSCAYGRVFGINKFLVLDKSHFTLATLRLNVPENKIMAAINKSIVTFKTTVVYT